MDNRFDDLFNSLKNFDAPKDLDAKILKAVNRRQKRRGALTGFLYAALMAAVSMSVMSVWLLVSDVFASPIADLVRLPLTDGREVAGSFGIWVMAIIEAVPIGSLTLALGAIFVVAILAARVRALPKSNYFIKEV